MDENPAESTPASSCCSPVKAGKNLGAIYEVAESPTGSAGSQATSTPTQTFSPDLAVYGIPSLELHNSKP